MARNKPKLEKIIDRYRLYIENVKHDLFERQKLYILDLQEMNILHEFEKAINEIDNYCKERKRY